MFNFGAWRIKTDLWPWMECEAHILAWLKNPVFRPILDYLDSVDFFSGNVQFQQRFQLRFCIFVGFFGYPDMLCTYTTYTGLFTGQTVVLFLYTCQTRSIDVPLISVYWIEINETLFLRPILKSVYNLMRSSHRQVVAFTLTLTSPNTYLEMVIWISFLSPRAFTLIFQRWSKFKNSLDGDGSDGSSLPPPRPF